MKVRSLEKKRKVATLAQRNSATSSVLSFAGDCHFGRLMFFSFFSTIFSFSSILESDFRWHHCQSDQPKEPPDYSEASPSATSRQFRSPGRGGCQPFPTIFCSSSRGLSLFSSSVVGFALNCSLKTELSWARRFCSSSSCLSFLALQRMLFLALTKRIFAEGYVAAANTLQHARFRQRLSLTHDGLLFCHSDIHFSEPRLWQHWSGVLCQADVGAYWKTGFYPAGKVRKARRSAIEFRPAVNLG